MPRQQKKRADKDLYRQDINLFRAIIETAFVNVPEATRLIEKYINDGADPSSDVEFQKDKYAHIISVALRFGMNEIVSAIFKQAMSKGVRIDLGQEYINEFGYSLEMNIYQFAVARCDKKIRETVNAYGKSTGQDLYDIANQKIIIESDDKSDKAEVCLAEVMACSISINSLLARCIVDRKVYSDAEEQAILDYLKKWKYYNPKYNNGENFPSFGKPIRLIANGSKDAINALLTTLVTTDGNKTSIINIKDTSSSDLLFPEFLNCVATCDSLEQWVRHFMGFVSNYSNLYISGDQVSMLEPGVFAIKTQQANIIGQCPIDIEVIFDLRELNELVQKKQTRHDSIDELQQKMKAVESTLSDLPDVRIKTIQACMKDNAKVLDCFNLIYEKICTQVLASKIAETGKFVKKSTNETVQIAKVAHTVFQSLIEGIPAPFVTVIPAITGALLNMAIEHQISTQNGAVVKLTRGLDERRIAMDIAAIIAAVYMKNQETCKDPKIADKLAALVVDKMNHLKHCASQADLVGYLCSDAVNMLNKQTIKKTDSGNSDSNTTPLKGSDHSGHLADNTEAKNKKANPGGCCSIS